MPGTAKMTWMSRSCSHWPHQPCAPNSITNTRPAMTGEIGERQVDQRDQQALALELEFRDRPGGRDAEQRIDRHDDRRREQRQLDRGERVRVVERLEEDAPALRERLRQHGAERRQQQQRQEADGDRDQRDAPGTHAGRHVLALLEPRGCASHVRPRPSGCADARAARPCGPCRPDRHGGAGSTPAPG